MIIITRCPYRVSLLGGSSDLEWFVEENGKGMSLGFSIKLFTRIIISYRKLNDRGILNYSSREIYKDIESISHPIIRSSFKRFNIQKKVELCSIGESIAGSGLGSSSSFTVALVKAISEINSLGLNNNKIAHYASEIEIKDLQKPIGRQDQYLCALGGANILEFSPGGIVNTKNHPKIIEAIENFSKNLYLVNTSINRNATEKLSDLKKQNSSKKFIKDLLAISDSFIDKSLELNTLDIQELLKLSMKKSWEIKKRMHGVMNQDLIDFENKIIKADFSVLKLLGAGGGGYFCVMFNGNNLEKSKSELLDYGLKLSKIELSKEGCKACYF